VQTAKPIDVLLSGRNDGPGDQAVIVELKQWETAEATAREGMAAGRGVKPCGGHSSIGAGVHHWPPPHFACCRQNARSRQNEAGVPSANTRLHVCTAGGPSAAA